MPLQVQVFLLLLLYITTPQKRVSLSATLEPAPRSDLINNKTEARPLFCRTNDDSSWYFLVNPPWPAKPGIPVPLRPDIVRTPSVLTLLGCVIYVRLYSTTWVRQRYLATPHLPIVTSPECATIGCPVRLINPMGILFGAGKRQR